MTETTYADGRILTSSALTLAQINALLQPMTLGLLGLPIVADSQAVRVAWPTVGAPFANVQDDICYLRCTLEDGDYDKIRYQYIWQLGWGSQPWGAPPYDDNIDILEQWNYTRSWMVHWCLYGPNSLDRARLLKSGLYRGYFTNELLGQNLFPMSEFPAYRRVPENIDGQWFERVDFEITMEEWVTEYIAGPTVASVPVIVNNEYGNPDSLIVTAPGG